MKTTSTLRHFLLIAGSSLIAVSSASAATYYWDQNSTTAGFGTAGGTWNTSGSSTWNLDPLGGNAGVPAGIQSTSTLTTDVVNFGTAAAGLGAGTINVGTVSSGNMTFGSASGPITLTGGTLTLAATHTTTVNNAVNTISSALAGTSTSFTKAGAGTLVLSGTNTNTGLWKSTGGTLIFRGTAALNNRQIHVTDATGTFRIESDTGFNSGTTAGIQSYGSGVMNLQVDRQTAGSGAALTYTFNGAVANNDISNGATVNFSAGPNITSGTPTINFANGLRNNGATSLTPFTLNADGVNVRANGISGGSSGRDKNVVLGGTSTGNEIYGAIGNNHRHAITKNGTGTWTFSGTNSYLSATTVNAGTLAYTGNVASGTPFGIDAMTISGGILKIAPTGTGSNVAYTGGTEAANTNFTFNAGATLELARGTQTSLTYTYGFSGAGTAFARGTNGTLILSTSNIANFGADGTKAERFIINSLSTAPSTVNGLVTGVVIQDRATSSAGDFAGYNGTDGFTKGAYSSTNAFANVDTDVVNITTSGVSTGGATAAYALRVNGNTLTNAGNTITLGSSGNATAGLILNGGTINGGTLTTPGSSATEFAIYTSGTSAISSSINTATSQAGLSVFGPGTLNLSDSSGNSFTGGLRINNSTVIATADNQLGGTTSQIALNGGTLQTSGIFALGGGNRAIALSGNGGTINVTSGTTTYQNASGKLMSGTGALIKSGAGTLVLSGNQGNTYTGGTFVNEGTLQLGAATKLADTGAVTVNGGTFDIQGNSDTVGTVTLISGNINGGAGILTGTSFNVRDGSISAKLGGGATVNLTKSTPGTVTLSGANTYTGFTYVEGGTLVLASTGSTAAGSAVTVGAGVTANTPVAKLSGTGTVNGSLSLMSESAAGSKNGGVLSPTAAASLTALDVGGTTTFGAGSIFEWNMSATDPATDPGVVANSGSYGQLAGTGTIGGSGAVFSIVLGSGNAFADAFWDSNKSWTNVFSGAGATNTLASIFSSMAGTGITWADNKGTVADEGHFSFSGTSTLTWTAIPEPSSALAGLLLTAGLLRRRRKC